MPYGITQYYLPPGRGDIPDVMGLLIIDLIANFLENLSVKKFENRLWFDELTAISLVSPFLWDTTDPRYAPRHAHSVVRKR